MKYGPKITNQIFEELRKMPNIRYVCKKLGIHPSSFYRWRSKHHTFDKLVECALFEGRGNMNDAAEAVIIQGIQNGDLPSAKYWLSHNSPAYSTAEQSNYLIAVRDTTYELLNKKPTEPRQQWFEANFEVYYHLENQYQDKRLTKWKEKAKEMIDPFVKYICQEDPEIEEIFYAAYEEWKHERDDYMMKKLRMNAHNEEHFGDLEERKKKLEKLAKKYGLDV